MTTSLGKGHRNDNTDTGLAGYRHSIRSHAQDSPTPRARSYLEVHRQFTFSVITRYEVLRGLLAKGASKQLAAFDKVCAASQVLPLSDPIIVQAATVYADLHRRGELISDADILIAATVIINGLAVITNNQAHFRRIRDLQVLNWLT